MEKLRKVLSIVAVLLTIAFCASALTACDPDEVDAFASGYRDGYYGNY